MNQMRDRLIGLIKKMPKEMWQMELADYLLANGVIVPPCKVGDEVWAIRNYKGKKHIQRGFVSQIYFREDMSLKVVVKHRARGLWGERIFSTQEEAERALEGGAE